VSLAARFSLQKFSGLLNSESATGNPSILAPGQGMYAQTGINATFGINLGLVVERDTAVQ
jgi:hypothetical protein